MIKPAKIVHLDLPEGQDYAWYHDLNIVALAKRLDAAGRQRALDELLAEWRAALSPLRPPAPGEGDSGSASAA